MLKTQQYVLQVVLFSCKYPCLAITVSLDLYAVKFSLWYIVDLLHGQIFRILCNFYTNYYDRLLVSVKRHHYQSMLWLSKQFMS